MAENEKVENNEHNRMDEILRYWAADREITSVLNISEIEFDFDNGWPGTDVTPGELPEIVVKYTVTKKVVYRHSVAELGDFISQLAFYARQPR